MKYISIDIETTGLNVDTCQLIEVGMVIDYFGNDTPLKSLPKFQTYVTHSSYQGEAFALSMHSEIFKRIANRDPNFNYVSSFDLGEAIRHCLLMNGCDPQITVAGKNFQAFDALFLKKYSPDIQWNYRSIDVGNLFLQPTDQKIPSLSACLDRAGFPEREVQHSALEDALDVVRCIRAWYSKNTEVKMM